MFETRWEDIRDKNNEIIQRIEAYNKRIRKGNYFEYDVELDVSIYYNFLMGHIINLLMDDKSLYLSKHVISSLNLSQSTIIDFIEWDLSDNYYLIKEENFNEQIIPKLDEYCFDEKSKKFIQEICSQDIASSSKLAKDVSSILTNITNAIIIDSFGEENFWNQISNTMKQKKETMIQKNM